MSLSRSFFQLSGLQMLFNKARSLTSLLKQSTPLPCLHARHSAKAEAYDSDWQNHLRRSTDGSLSALQQQHDSDCICQRRCYAP